MHTKFGNLFILNLKEWLFIYWSSVPCVCIIWQRMSKTAQKKHPKKIGMKEVVRATRENRAECNDLSEEQRAKLLEEGMKLFPGSSQPAATCRI
jgi:hypothetical protein